MISVIKHKKKFLFFSGTLVVLSFIPLILWGLKPGIDFTGGSLWEIEFIKDRPSNEAILASLQDFKLDDALIQPTGEKGVILRFRNINEKTHEAAYRYLNDLSPLTEKYFQTIGPTIGAELKTKSLQAIAVVLILIVAYIAWAFRRVSRPVASWKYGVIAIVALVHDVTIPAGVFSFLGKFYGIEVDALFITALLTVLGFSVHDTIVVFDRIRENLKRRPSEDFSKTIDASINETITRSINTSFTVILVLLAIFFLGGESTKFFALTLILGVFFGTYSSIFVAGPLLDWAGKRVKKQNRV